MADPRDFLLNTDYEQDKIIYCQKLKIDATAPKVTTIEHGLPTVPLILGVWSPTEDFTETHSLVPIEPADNGAYCWASSTYKTVNVYTMPKQNEDETYQPTTFYIYLFGLEPSDNYYSGNEAERGAPSIVHQKIAATKGFAKQFILNTDYNYMKLLTSRPEFVFDDQTGIGTYHHGLGYIPFLLTWGTFGWDDDGGEWDIMIDSADSVFSYNDTGLADTPATSGVFVDEDDIYYYGSGIVPTTLIMRVYADEA